MRKHLRWTPYDVGSLVWYDAPYGRWATTGSAPLACGSNAVVAIGAFDGLHVGHRALLAAAAADAASRGLPLVAVTFDPDPAMLFADARESVNTRLLRCDDRVVGLLEAGADAVLTLHFDERLAAMAPRSFVDDVLRATIVPASMHVGENFRFGKNGSGDVRVLSELGAVWGFSVIPHELVCESGSPVSATRVRALLADGRLDEATDLLGRHHYVRGVVEHGRGEATAFGFPTANVRCDALDCMPAKGVYACYVTSGSHAWSAAANVGAPPTFGGDGTAFLEANLLGFDGNLYDRQVCVSFIEWLRPSRVFDSLEELERVVLGNIAWVAENLGSEELVCPRSNGMRSEVRHDQ